MKTQDYEDKILYKVRTDSLPGLASISAHFILIIILKLMINGQKIIYTCVQTCERYIYIFSYKMKIKIEMVGN